MLVQNGNLDCVKYSKLCSNDPLMSAATGFHCKAYIGLYRCLSCAIFCNSTADAIC